MQTYTVKRGDSLSRIAAVVYRDPNRWRLLAAANRISDPRLLMVGQILQLPSEKRKAVRANPDTTGLARDITISDARLAKLAPNLAERGGKLVRSCREAGVRIRVTEGLRTWAEQDALYACGRTKPGRVVTNARGGQSFHNYGLAFDIVLLSPSEAPIWDAQHPGWATAGQIGVALGLTWGGHWRGFKDLPHFEMRAQLSLEECRAFYPERLQELWNRVT
jgi:peptidoglycan L-alanyl-D-glutamate endopeptidase CwlK